KGEGPVIHRPVRSEADVARLAPVDVASAVGFVFETVRLVKRALPAHVPLIGFAGAPFTVASYVVEGGASRDYLATKRLMRETPAAWRRLMTILADATAAYLNGQIAAGAAVVQLFDSWVGALSPDDYRELDLPHTRAVISALTPGTPVIHFGTGPAAIRPFLANVGRGRNIPRERLEEVARHYEAMPGGRSPLNALTEAQAAGLRAALVRGGRPLPVYVGMRNWHPFLHETLASMAADGRRRAVGLILSAFRSEASWERYAADVAAARARVAGAPEVVYAPPWFEHEHFIAAAADRAAAALAEIPPQ